ncbi:MAG: glycosyltransferase [Chloroflexota bacterium]
MSKPLKPDVSIILPTYNERDNICDLIDAICVELQASPNDIHPATHPKQFEILVMDDNSPDGTAAVVRDRYNLGEDNVGALQEMGMLYLHVRTAENGQEKGLANSIIDGLQRATGHTLVVMDTDFNHDPAMIPQMVDLLRYYDLVIGSRFVMKGGMEDTGRYWASFAYNVFIRTLFHSQIQDNLSGFFAVRQERLFELQPDFDKIFYGYGDYFIRLLYVAWRSDWEILEVPVFYILRRHGDSKTGFWSIFQQYTRAVLKLRVNGL